VTATAASLCAWEARMIARRAAPPDMMGAVAEALALCGTPVPPALAEAGAGIARRVERHGLTFPAGAEPSYHGRHHQAEATLAAAWLVSAAPEPGPGLGRLCVLAMAGHDLLHDGRGAAPGALEARSANATLALCGALDVADRAEIERLILLTDPLAPAPADEAGRLVREADLFGSLTPRLGWRLSEALAREHAAAGLPGAAAIVTYAGRAALLGRFTRFTEGAVALGLAAGVAAQLAALAEAGGAQDPQAGAARLDAMPREAARARHDAALAARGLAGSSP
jgi:hypothetical protein